MMGGRYPEEKPYSFYDPEQDWEGLRAGPPRHRSAPVSPRGPISPRATPPGIYPPELDHGYYNRSGLPGSPHEQPFGPYDLEQDLRERPRQGMGAPFRPPETDLGYYNPGLRNPKELDSRSKGVGRGVAPPPLYVNPNSEHLSIPQGAPPNGKFGPGVPLNDRFRQGAPPSDNYGRGALPNDNYAGRAPPSDNYGRGALPNDNYAGRAPPNESYARGAPLNDRYQQGAPLSDGYGQRAPPSDGYGRGAPPSDGYGRGAPPNDGYGRGAPPNDSYRRGAPPSDNHVQGTPLNDSYARGTPPNDKHGRGAPPHGIYEHEAPSQYRYGHEPSPNDIYEQGVPPSDTFGRGSLESGYAGRGISRRAPGTPGNNYGALTSGTRPPYADESFGYTRGLGRGQGVVPLGDGRYEYGGLHQPERLGMEEDYNRGASTPAPISSEYAHQVYASVFSDPVYGGARQLNSQARYHEEPNSLQQTHRREDVLQHPDDF